jgi:hypothetical protein
LPREPPTPTTAPKPVRPTSGLSPYASAALDGACRNIIAAPDGSQHDNLIRECFVIGGLARDALLWATRQMPAYDPRRPWREAELQKQVNQSFDYGSAHPRGGNHGGDFRQ